MIKHGEKKKNDALLEMEHVLSGNELNSTQLSSIVDIG